MVDEGFFGNIALVDGRVFGLSFEEHSLNEFFNWWSGVQIENIVKLPWVLYLFLLFQFQN
jgi:hypothetical protein